MVKGEILKYVLKCMHTPQNADIVCKESSYSL